MYMGLSDLRGFLSQMLNETSEKYLLLFITEDDKQPNERVMGIAEGVKVDNASRTITIKCRHIKDVETFKAMSDYKEW